MELQKYLRDGHSPEDLKEELAINHRRHSVYNNLVSFKYDQLDSPRNHPIVMECRGIILDENDNWDVVAYPFRRFFNSDEGHAADIDWGSAVVQEKLDGSLVIMFYYHDSWHVATSGSADAGGNVGITTRIFRDYFWDTARKTLPSNWLEPAQTDCCYMFELMGPDNRVVVYHPKEHLKLLGARHIKTLQELSAKEAANHFNGVEHVKEYPLNSIAEIVASFEELSPISHEGYVVVDRFFNRIKIKNPAYVAIHHAKDGLTTKAFVEIARQGEISEMIAHFPEYKPMLEEAKIRFRSLVKELQDEYDSIKHIKIQKEFAFAALRSRCSGALFAYRAKKVDSISDYLRQMHIHKVMTLLGYKEDG